MNIILKAFARWDHYQGQPYERPDHVSITYAPVEPALADTPTCKWGRTHKVQARPVGDGIELTCKRCSWTDWVREGL